jgi:hypothetical protein
VETQLWRILGYFLSNGDRIKMHMAFSACNDLNMEFSSVSWRWRPRIVPA